MMTHPLILALTAVMTLALSACSHVLRSCDETKMHMGMTQADVQQACGSPDKVSIVNGHVDHWFYYWSSDYIAFDKDGLVNYWNFDR